MSLMAKGASNKRDASEPATVLVVDDNEANRLLAQHTLEDEGYRVVLAQNGAEGVAAFERCKPACVILDVRMPGVDGFTACERIRAMPGGAHVPVLFLTALRDVDTFDRALHSGGDDFLTKPVQPTELVVRVETALKLRRLRTELNDQYEALKRQRDDLMRLQLQKERLTAFLIHDLKNPVNAISLHAQLLLRLTGTSDAVTRSASQIKGEAAQLNRMILNLLDISKAEEGMLAPKKTDVDLRALVGDVAVELEPTASSRSVTIANEVDPVHIDVDGDLLKRTIANLVENALRHAPKGSTVTIASQALDDAVEIRVRDSGIGIPQEMRNLIFEPFTQIEGHERPSTRGGRGLGLTFCKLAVEAHGGRISIEDANPGASFCVRLPK